MAALTQRITLVSDCQDSVSSAILTPMQAAVASVAHMGCAPTPCTNYMSTCFLPTYQIKGTDRKSPTSSYPASHRVSCPALQQGPCLFTNIAS